MEGAALCSHLAGCQVVEDGIVRRVTCLSPGNTFRLLFPPSFFLSAGFFAGGVGCSRVFPKSPEACS